MTNEIRKRDFTYVLAEIWTRISCLALMRSAIILIILLSRRMKRRKLGLSIQHRAVPPVDDQRLRQIRTDNCNSLGSRPRPLAHARIVCMREGARPGTVNIIRACARGRGLEPRLLQLSVN